MYIPYVQVANLNLPHLYLRITTVITTVSSRLSKQLGANTISTLLG